MKLAAGIVPDLTPLRTSKDFRAVFGSRTVAYLGTQAATPTLCCRSWRPSCMPHGQPGEAAEELTDRTTL